ncbi:outer membrane protein assembly factor BamB family protein, partial [Streptomyces calidiresistens]
AAEQPVEPSGVASLPEGTIMLGPLPTPAEVAGSGRHRGTPSAGAGASAPPSEAGPREPADASAPVAASPPAPAAAPVRWRPWRFRMSNELWGSPTARDGLLYVSSFEVHALDIATGRRQFKTRDVAWLTEVAGGRLLASDGPSLRALDAADGTEHWSLAPEGWIYSLAVDRGTVVTGIRGGGVQAVEIATGERLWGIDGAQTDFETADTGPVVAHGTVYTRADDRLYALEARTGAELWSHPVGDASATGGVPVRLRPGPDTVHVSAGTRLFALDAEDGTERWRFDAPAALLCPPAPAPSRRGSPAGVWVVDYLGTVYALDAADGTERWRIATEPRNSSEPVLVADGLVHLAAGSAVYTLDAVHGTPCWRFGTGGPVVGSPVVAAGRVHFGSEDHCLYTLDAVTGRLSWKLEMGGAITGTPAVAGGMLFACSQDRCVYALDAGRGTRQSSRSS